MIFQFPILSASSLYQTATVPPTSLGLVSNFNYFFTNGGNNIDNLSVQIDLENNLEMDGQGVSFQINTWPRNASGPPGVPCWIQFILVFQPAAPNNDNNAFGSLFASIQMWDTTFAEIACEFLTLGSIESQTFLAGSQFNISVLNDNNGLPTGAKFSSLVLGEKTTTESTQIILLNDANRALSLPFNLFTFNIVSSGNYQRGNFSNGSGTIRYAAVVPLHPIPWGPKSPIEETGETSNAAYSLMTNESGIVLEQKWAALGKPQNEVNLSDFTGPNEQKRRV